ncbi:hypothetical protein EJ05DRAFT_324836 [Pseudovirgaria hyperparasitica]|uniref:Uncharacterized protein n=1 Tax=Pseudovirgaria hyperparasitica TaxID=470096 RepID=A0A6A6WA17_9PEZI|nr:uncharacterized protein EJ05DRAFT_324836 [Pseudovirgaria hyperparasitica]KAF2758874.1 hypothetical protein EJ05DRAFT_324836 [Pseudovirgaria hyperparasitica]
MGFLGRNLTLPSLASASSQQLTCRPLVAPVALRWLHASPVKQIWNIDRHKTLHISPHAVVCLHELYRASITRSIRTGHFLCHSFKANIPLYILDRRARLTYHRRKLPAHARCCSSLASSSSVVKPAV